MDATNQRQLTAYVRDSVMQSMHVYKMFSPMVNLYKRNILVIIEIQICRPNKLHNNQIIRNVCTWMKQQCGHAAISMFPTADVCRARWPGSDHASVTRAKVATLLNSLFLFFVFNI